MESNTIRKRSGAVCRLPQHSVKTEDVRGVVVGQDIWWRRAHRVRKHRSLVDLGVHVGQYKQFTGLAKEKRTDRQAGIWGDRRVG